MGLLTNGLRPWSAGQDQRCTDIRPLLAYAMSGSVNALKLAICKANKPINSDVCGHNLRCHKELAWNLRRVFRLDPSNRDPLLCWLRKDCS